MKKSSIADVRYVHWPTHFITVLIVFSYRPLSRIASSQWLAPRSGMG